MIWGTHQRTKQIKMSANMDLTFKLGERDNKLNDIPEGGKCYAKKILNKSGRRGIWSAWVVCSFK